VHELHRPRHDEIQEQVPIDKASDTST
jgi:hypothetical protein